MSTHPAHAYRAVLLALAFLCACQATPAPERFDLGLPREVAAPRPSADNPLTRAKVELGRQLFFERKLSADGTFACASCHRPELAYTDGLVVARGLSGESLPRNTQSLANVAYFEALTWANPKLHTLEGQALVPLLATRPRELGVAKLMDEVCARLREEPAYVERFERAFPTQAEPIDMANIVAALASFERTLLSFGSPYDAFLAGDRAALSAAAQRGKQLFESERLHCASCHRGRLLSDAASAEGAAMGEAAFHNTGLYNLGGRSLYPVDNPGLYEFTRRASDMGRFRTPSLRNVARTAPYMHDGSIADLEGVLRHYAAGGRTIADGPYAGIGADSLYKDARIAGFTLRESERADLLAFLNSLTDPAFARPLRGR
ncbi:MAG: cytochrome peroxidase [Myxococcaceae bacterium]|nr:cytochrome peroxidase [Myxococcaceae bacterium]